MQKNSTKKSHAWTLGTFATFAGRNGPKNRQGMQR